MEKSAARKRERKGREKGKKERREKVVGEKTPGTTNLDSFGRVLSGFAGGKENSEGRGKKKKRGEGREHLTTCFVFATCSSPLVST